MNISSRHVRYLFVPIRRLCTPIHPIARVEQMFATQTKLRTANHLSTNVPSIQFAVSQMEVSQIPMLVRVVRTNARRPMVCIVLHPVIVVQLSLPVPIPMEVLHIPRLVRVGQRYVLQHLVIIVTPPQPKVPVNAVFQARVGLWP